MRYATAIVFAICLLLTGCATTANYGPDAEANKTQTRSFDATYSDVYRAAIQTAAAQDWSIQNSERDAGFFRAQTPASLGAWSDEVSVALQELDTGKIEITVRSNLGQEPNRQVVGAYLDRLAERLE